MHLTALSSLVAAVATGFLAHFVYGLNKSSPLNRVFALFCASAALYSFGDFMFHQADTLSTALFWHRATGFIWVLPVALSLHFALVFTEKKRLAHSRAFLTLLYVSAGAVFAIGTLSAPDTSKQSWGYMFLLDGGWPVPVVMAWSAVVGLAPIVMCGRQAYRATGDLRAQSILVGLGYVFPFVAVLAIGVQGAAKIDFPELVTVGLTMMTGFIGYAIWRYELFLVNPITVADNIISTMNDSLTLFDRHGKIVLVNRATLDMLGYRESELIGKDSSVIFSDPARVASLLEDLAMGRRAAAHMESSFKAKDARTIPIVFSGSVIKDNRGAIAGLVGIARDITRRKQAEETIRHMAYYDSLTDLPNRTLFMDRLNQALASARRNRTSVALCFFDLDGFKDVNDSLGHKVGDQLLKAVAKRLAPTIREIDTLARLGGDEFALIGPGVDGEDEALALADKIVKAFELPFEVDGHVLGTSASVGVTVYPVDRGNAEELLMHADIAMYQAKALGRSCCQLYVPTQEKAA